MKNEQKNNAYINYSKNGDFYNLYMTLTLNNGEIVRTQIKVFTFNNQVDRKLKYKIVKGIDEYVPQK